MRRNLYLMFLALGFAVINYSSSFAEEPKEPAESNIPQLLANKSIPQEVRAALPSITRVVALRPNIIRNLFMPVKAGDGFVVGDHLVITCTHIIAIAEGEADHTSYYVDTHKTQVEIQYDDKKYEADIVAYSPLFVLLRVKDGTGSKFDKKPLPLSPLNLNDFQQGPLFAFAFVAPGIVFFKEFRYFSGYFIDRDINHGSVMERGTLSERIGDGYSGTPLLDSRGQCRGILEGDYYESTILIPADQIIEFLEKARKGLSDKK